MNGWTGHSNTGIGGPNPPLDEPATMERAVDRDHSATKAAERESRHEASRGRIVLVIGLATAAAPPAGAAVLNGCPDQPMSRPFLRWLDPIQYTLAPDGGFEAGARGWQLKGGAAVVSGNESFALSGHWVAIALPPE